jgi:hypothetical protein
MPMNAFDDDDVDVQMDSIPLSSSDKMPQNGTPQIQWSSRVQPQADVSQWNAVNPVERRKSSGTQQQVMEPVSPGQAQAMATRFQGFNLKPFKLWCPIL